MEKERRYFPVFFSLEGKKILIVGAGQIATRRAKVLLSFGADVRIVAPEYCGELEKIGGSLGAQTGGEGKRGALHCEKRTYEERDLQDMDIVLAATDDEALNHRIAVSCRRRKIPVNNASSQTDCDFFFPAVIQAEGLTIGVSSGGGDHKKVAKVCEKLRCFFGAAL